MTKTNFFAFISGAVIGGFVVYRYMTAMSKAEKETQSIDDNVTLVTKPAPHIDMPLEPKKPEGPTDVKSSLDVKSLDNDHEKNFTDYVNMTRVYKDPENETPEAKKYRNLPKPYVIDPAELGEGYDGECDIVELTYYADGILADEIDDAISEDDIEALIGLESLEHFGEYEEDSVAVRNERLHIDYLILRSVREYCEVEKSLPPSKRRKGIDGLD